MPTEPIRPLQDVWLRPRRVFRELSSQPVGRVDRFLGAAQGIVGWLAWSRAQDAGATESLAHIFGAAVLAGSAFGIASLYLMAAIYARLGSRSASAELRRQVVHVLAYGGVPSALSIAVWLVTALLAGQATFEQTQRPDVEDFLALVLRAQFSSYVFLMIWSVVLQVMGFSEILGITNLKALAILVLGQLVVVLAALFVVVLFATLFP